MKFRALRPSEVDVRIGTVSKSGAGVSLLLYKDARCDMNILDEAVGPLNWQRTHTRDNSNCTVSIWNEKIGQWVSKEDTGTESNTEKEKGLASDSFKRACFNWGIGRELYTGGFIWVPKDKLKKLSQTGEGQYKKWTCSDSFHVSKMVVDEETKTISILEIKNESGTAVFYAENINKQTQLDKINQPKEEEKEEDKKPKDKKPEKVMEEVEKVPNIQEMKDKLMTIKQFTDWLSKATKKDINLYSDAKIKEYYEKMC